MMDKEATSKKMKKSRRRRRTTTINKGITGEISITESLQHQ
jgi:hypothetical protein